MFYLITDAPCDFTGLNLETGYLMQDDFFYSTGSRFDRVIKNNVLYMYILKSFILFKCKGLFYNLLVTVLAWVRVSKWNQMRDKYRLVKRLW